MSVFGLDVGDVIFTNGNTIAGSINVCSQKLLRMSSKPTYSHVALSIGEGVFIHALTDKGVCIEFLPDILINAKSDWKVVRNVTMTEATREMLSSLAIYNYEKCYNFGFLLKEKEHSLFCSQLIDVVYREIGINIIPGRKEEQFKISNVFPIDIDEATTSSSEWVNVTEHYKQQLADVMEDLRRFYEIKIGLVKIQKDSTASVNNVINSMVALRNSLRKLPDNDALRHIDSDLGKEIGELELSEKLFRFWDDRK